MPIALSPQSSALAFVFPGQGSQALGMLAELASEYAVVKATFEEASAGAGADLFTCSLFTSVADADGGTDFAPAAGSAASTRDRAHAMASTTMAMPSGSLGNRRAITDTIDLPAAPAPDGGGRSDSAGWRRIIAQDSRFACAALERAGKLSARRIGLVGLLLCLRIGM